ncbi:MAG: AzlC family ABC transporter permease [Lachnospiraceae bacterium]
MKHDLKKAFIATIPVMSGYLVLGMGFGILLETKGYGVWWAAAMSIFIYAGSMQYVAINLLSSGASLIATALTTLMVNARHLFYGISMIERYRNAGKRKAYLIAALTDETYSLVCSEDAGKEAKEEHRYYFLVSLLNQVYWVAGSIIGSMVGAVLPFDTTGIEFALTALFVTIFVEQWMAAKDHLSALIGVISSVVCLLIFGSRNFLIPAMLLITASLSVVKMVRREEI